MIDAARRLIPELESLQPGESIISEVLTSNEVFEAAHTFLSEALEESGSTLNLAEFTIELNQEQYKKEFDQPLRLRITRKRQAQ